MSKDWDQVKTEWITEHSNIHPVVLRYLWQKGFGVDEVSALYEFDYETDLHDPFLLPDMQPAVDRTIQAIDTNQKIIVFGDYDADGLPGVAILDTFFKKINFNNYQIIIPDRNVDGFGLKVSHIDRMIEEKADLVITVDCGSAAIEALEYAKKQNLDVIVTDHHEVAADFDLDLVVALVNPMTPESKYPFKSICGAAVVFKLVQAFITHGKKASRSRLNDFLEGQEKWLLDLVAVATVGDMMPLIDENRTLVYYGLKVLNQTRNYGLRALIDSTGIERGKINETDIGFRIAPRLNAASRVGRVDLALGLLTASDPLSANRAAAELDASNNERKKILTQMVKVAHKKLGPAAEYSDQVLVVGDPEWLPGMCGLLSSRLVEEYGVSAFVWGRGPGDQIKGSARAAGTDNVYELMQALEPGIFIGYGGHAGAGGFVLEESSAHKLVGALLKAKEKIKDLPMAEVSQQNNVIQVDPDELNQDLLTAVTQLSPFGVGFEAPQFQIRCQAQYYSFGKNKDHLKVVITNRLQGIMWRTRLEDLSVDQNKEVLVTGVLEFDTYSHRPRLQIISITSDQVN